MSIMIKGIDMPINCTRCPCSNDESRFCRAANEYIPMLGKPDFCPLEEAEERKKGEWIEAEVTPKAFDVNGIETWASKMQCDQCGFITYAIEGHMGQYNFCPNCGADMRERREE